ncbi:MAG: sulfatase [Pirellulales bacterium]
MKLQSLFVAGVLGLGLGGLGLGSVSARGAVERPNILFIMSDDHAAQAIGAYGSKINQTPHIDRLAKEGMRFDNCFVTNSICTPSRAAIFTGQYAHINGVKTFVPIDPELVTLPKLLRAAGYHTAIVGKYHLHSNPRGFDYWSILPGQGRYHDPEFVEMGDESPSGRVAKGKRTTHPGYVTDIITDKTLDYLKNIRPKDRPFMLMYHHKAPHDPWLYDEKHAHLFTDEIPEPATLLDDYSGRTDAIGQCTQKIGVQHTLYPRETRHLEGVARKKAQYQQYMQRYLRCIASVDDNIGRVLDYLDSSGLAKNTIVIYTSDQGFFLGEHGLYDKRLMYEEALRMPLLIRWPGVIEPNSTNGDLVLNVDFAPTLLEAAGVDEAPVPMQGRSFAALLEGATPSDWRRSMYYRYYFSHFNTEPHYGVRTLRYKLICFHRLGQWELFDLEKDPLEMTSVHADPAYADVVKKLKTELKRLQAELGDEEN